MVASGVVLMRHVHQVFIYFSYDVHSRMQSIQILVSIIN